MTTPIARPRLTSSLGLAAGLATGAAIGLLAQSPVPVAAFGLAGLLAPLLAVRWQAPKRQTKP